MPDDNCGRMVTGQEGSIQKVWPESVWLLRSSRGLTLSLSLLFLLCSARRLRLA